MRLKSSARSAISKVRPFISTRPPKLPSAISCVVSVSRWMGWLTHRAAEIGEEERQGDQHGRRQAGVDDQLVDVGERLGERLLHHQAAAALGDGAHLGEDFADALGSLDLVARGQRHRPVGERVEDPAAEARGLAAAVVRPEDLPLAVDQEDADALPGLVPGHLFQGLEAELGLDDELWLPDLRGSAPR